MTLDFRLLSPDDFPQLLEVRARSYGPGGGDSEAFRVMNQDLIDQGRNFGVFDGPRLVGSGKIAGFHQWWNGREVAMAGVAGVVVAPDARGKGVSGVLMRGLMGAGRALGDPVSALYPAVSAPYRRVGYEFAGGQHRYSVATAALRRLGGSAPVRRATAADARHLAELCATAYSANGDLGPIQWPASEWRTELADDDNYVYLADDGVVWYGWDGRGGLVVHFMYAADEDTARSLWSVVGSGSSTADRTTAYLAPHDPLEWLLPDQLDHEVSRKGWMFRLLDVGAALEQRGYPGTLSAETTLRVEDPDLPANEGTWSLRVTAGEGIATRVAEDRDAAVVGPRGLACLYAGRPTAALRRAGLLSGGGLEDDHVLDAAFAGPAAYLIDYF